MLKKIICLGLIFMMFMCLLCACEPDDEKETKTKYNVVVVDFTEFECRGTLTEYKDCPEYQIIIKSQERLDELYISFPEVDFEEEMVLVYGYETSSQTGHKINSIKLNDEVLIIEFTTKHSEGKTGLPPHPRTLVIKMEKLDFATVEFILV